MLGLALPGDRIPPRRERCDLRDRRACAAGRPPPTTAPRRPRLPTTVRRARDRPPLARARLRARAPCPSRSDPAAASSETSTARSAPIASALRSESTAFSGPSETRTTSPPCASLIRSASSTAFKSIGLSAASPERSSRFVAGSIRLCTVASGTCLTQTAIFIGADSIGGIRVARKEPQAYLC